MNAEHTPMPRVTIPGLCFWAVFTLVGTFACYSPALGQTSNPADAKPAHDKKEAAPEPKPAPKNEGIKTGGHYVILKTGEEYAVSHKAGDVLVKLGVYLGNRVFGKATVYEGHITNSPADAAKLVTEHKPHWGIVTPAFYLANKDSLKLRAVFETRREGAQTEQYTIFSRGKSLKLEDLAGKRIATTQTAERDWLDKVVLEQKTQVTWQQVTNLSDAAFAILDGDKNACDAVLADRITAKLFLADADLMKIFGVAWTSGELPPDLLVTFGDNIPAGDEAKLEAHLGLMKDDKEGQDILKTLQTSEWGEMNTLRLDACAKLLAAAAKAAPTGEDGKANEKKPADGGSK